MNEEKKETTKKVLVADNISEEGINKLREFADVDIELEYFNKTINIIKF